MNIVSNLYKTIKNTNPKDTMTTDSADTFESTPKAKSVRRGRPRSTDSKDPKPTSEAKESTKTPEEPKETQDDQSQNKENRPQNQNRNPKKNRNPNQNQNRNRNPNQQKQKNKNQQQQPKKKKKVRSTPGYDPLGGLILGNLPQIDAFKDPEALQALTEAAVDSSKEPLNFNDFYDLPLKELEAQLSSLGVEHGKIPHRREYLKNLLQWAHSQKQPIYTTGILDITSDGGFITYASDNYAIQQLSSFVPNGLIKSLGLERGHSIEALIHAPRTEETDNCPFTLSIKSIMGQDPSHIANITPFNELVPYFPTERIFLETNNNAEWDNLSMRVIDILTPIGLGQRGLIVAPPRTGKTILLQGIAHAIAENQPDAHLIVLLIDERPEEVTDFKRQVEKGEVIASTFDQPADSHVHVAEMVIEKSRRMLENGQDVIILLDSITRLARAYNTMLPSSGKILSGGVEANAMQLPKRFFGSARNIEDGGSLTILGTALIETGSRMDEVIFEEFKATGNMDLHLDRELVAKRLFPAVSIDKSGTRKEDLLYHKDEIEKIYGLRRAMKGVPPVEAMEMLLTRLKKTRTNAEFLLGLNR